MRSWRLILCPFVVSVLAFSLLNVVEDRESLAASNNLSCTDIHILGARGSGGVQHPNPDYDWYDDVVGRTVEKFKEQVSSFDPGMRFHDIALTEDQFPAPGDNQTFLGAYLKLPTGYHDSVVKGKHSGREAINAVIGNIGACVLFTGYSQGAQVAGDLLEEFAESHPDKVLGGMFYGDPYFNPWTAGASSGTWAIAHSPYNRGALGMRDEYPASLQGREISMCHGLDIVCQGPSAFSPVYGLIPHSSYARPNIIVPGSGTVDFTPEATLSARAIVSRMGFLRLPPSEYEAPVDVVFAVDTTGSMDGAIEDAKQYVREFPQALTPLLPDSRFGLVAYRDQGDDYVARIEAQPTADAEAFTAAVDGLEADGGGDIPEAVLAAVQTAINLDFRPEARKFVVLLGDAPGHDPDLVTGATLDEVVNEARLKFISVSALDYGGGVSTFDDLATGTGGVVIDPYADVSSRLLRRVLTDVTNDGERPRLRTTTSPRNGATNLLVETVISAVSQPSAQIAAPGPTYVAVPAGFTASRSSDPIGYIAQYEWDFDSDGVYDDITVAPTVQHTFSAVGSTTVTVRVTNDVGQTGVASVSVTVEPLPADYPDAPPDAPTAPTATAGNGSVVVTIQPNASGPTVRYYTLLEGGTENVLAVVGATEEGNPITTVRLDDAVNGQPYTFRVSATNERGDSALGPPSVAVTPSAPVRPPVQGPGPYPAPTPTVPPLEPGEAFAAERGLSVPASVDPLDPRVVRVSGSGFSVELDSKSSLGYPVTLNGRIMNLKPGGSLGVASPPGTWQGGSDLTLHLVSRETSSRQASTTMGAGTERLLGVAAVDQDGSARGTFVIPSDVQPGRFIVKISGGMSSGQERIVALGVISEVSGAPSISITGYRGAGKDSARVFISGVTTDLVSAEVTPWIKIRGQRKYSPGAGVRTVAEDGTFSWKRKSGKKMYVYFRVGDIRSNVARIPARE